MKTPVTPSRRSLSLAGSREQRSLLQPIVVEKRAGASTPLLTGHSAVFNSRSEDLGWWFEEILPGAFGDAIRGFDVVCLANHNADRLIAGTVNGTLSLAEDKIGLYMEAEPMDTQVCRDVMTEVESRLLNGQSFSFIVASDSWRMENGTEIRTIAKFERIYDVGPVVFPAYPATDVKARNLLGEQGIDIEGFSRAFVKGCRGLDLSAAERDIVKRASVVIQLWVDSEDEDDDVQEEPQEQLPPVTEDQPTSEAWRMAHFRRRLDLLAAG